jgi:hypothetical protein
MAFLTLGGVLQVLTAIRGMDRLKLNANMSNSDLTKEWRTT